MIRRCQAPTCQLRLRPGNTGSFCFRHGGTQPEAPDHRTAPAPSPGSRRRTYDPTRDETLRRPAP